MLYSRQKKEVVICAVENENVKLNDLEANKRNHKVEITDIAISKVPFIKYREIPEDQYELMVEHKCILSEKPDALDGALEWLQAEIKKLEEDDAKKKKVTEALKADIRPLVQKVAKKRGLVSNR